MPLRWYNGDQTLAVRPQKLTGPRVPIPSIGQTLPQPSTAGQRAPANLDNASQAAALACLVVNARLISYCRSGRHAAIYCFVHCRHDSVAVQVCGMHRACKDIHLINTDLAACPRRER